MRALAALMLILTLALCAVAVDAQTTAPAAPKQPATSLRVWASAEPGGQPFDRFLPGQKVHFNAQVTVEAAAPRTPVALSLWLTGPEGWRTELLPRVETTVAKLEPVLSRSYQWAEDMGPGLCGPYQFSARAQCKGADAVEKTAAFRIEAPIVLEKAWVDPLPLALPRPTSNRLDEGIPFYFHARHRVSDLVDTTQAQIMVEWRVLRGAQEVAELSASATKSISAEPQEIVLTRMLSPKPPPSSLLGVNVVECTAALGKFRSSPLRTTFVVTRQAPKAIPAKAAVELLSISAWPKVIRPGGEVALAMRYRVSGLREGESLPAIERQIVTGGEQERLLPMRSVERGNGTFEVRTHFRVPEGVTGAYLYEASLLGAGRKLCEGRAAFQVRDVEIRLSDLAVWPKEPRPGEDVTVAFKFSVSGLGRDEVLSVERVLEINGPWETRVTKKGTLTGALGVSYRTRLNITLPEDAPPGKYVVTATIVPERGTANRLEASFEVAGD